MIGAMVMHPKQSGPCVICGDTNYNLSCGGPTICPKCDCGNFDAATVQKQAKVIAELRGELERARGLLTLTLHTESSAPAQGSLREALDIHERELVDTMLDLGLRSKVRTVEVVFAKLREASALTSTDGGPQRVPCPGCDGYECDDGCQYPGAIQPAGKSDV